MSPTPRLASSFVTLALVFTLASSASAAWVLGPEAEPALRSLSAVMQAPFMEGDPGHIRVEAGRVTFYVWPERGAPEMVTLTREFDQAEGATLKTNHGFVAMPVTWDEEKRESVIGQLNTVDVTLPWIALDGPPTALTESDSLPKVSAEKVAALLRARRDAKSHRDRHKGKSDLPALDDSYSEDNLAVGARGKAERWAQAALRAEDEGYRRRALALADVATRISPPVPLAQETWQALRTRGGTAPLWPITWITLGFIFWFTATYLLTGGREDNPLRLAVAGILCLAFTGLLMTQGRPPERLRTPPAVPAVLEAPIAGLCESDPALWTGEGLVLHATCRSSELTFTIQTNPESVSGLPHVVSSQGDARSPHAQAALQTLRVAIAKAEIDGFRADAWQDDPPLARKRLPMTGSDDRVEASLSLGIVLLGVFILLWMQRSFVRVVSNQLRETPEVARPFAALALLWGGLHLLAPGYMVMEYTGYDLSARLAWLDDLPRYGAGAPWLYGWAVSLFGDDHTSIQIANRVFGLLTLLPMSAMLFSLMGKRGLWLIALYACLPVQWRDHLSEGIMTGTNWLLLSGLAAMICAWKRTLPDVAAPLALAPWMAACVCRPEVGPALVPIGLVLFILLVTGSDAARKKRVAFALLCGGVGAIVALWPHAMWLASEVSAQEQASGIHELTKATSSRVLDVILGNNILLDGPWVSPAVLLWLGAALALGRGHRLLVAGLTMSTLVWWAITSVDLPLVSIPRVHISTWLMLIPALGVGVMSLAALGARGRAINLGVGALVAAQALWFAPTALNASNADGEERLIRSAAKLMGDEPACLATVRFSDAPKPGSTQRHFPDYLFEPHQILGLDRFDEHWAQCEGRAYALLGTRCFMAFRGPEVQNAPSEGEIESCVRFRERFTLEPLVFEELPNRRDFTIPVYPERDTLPVGVYRVTAKRNAR